MEFLTALQAAREAGVNEQTFLPIWQAQTQLEQATLDARAQEARVALAELEKRSTSGNQPAIIKLFEQQRDEIAKIRSEIMCYQQSVLQVIGEVSKVLSSKQLPIKPKTANPHLEQDHFDSIDLTALNCGKDLQTQGHDKQLLDACQITHLNTSSNALKDVHQEIGHQMNGFRSLNLDMKQPDLHKGLCFKVDGLTSLYENCGERLSPSYTLPKCPCTFHLSVSFSSREELIVDIVVTRVADMKGFMKWPVSLQGVGFVKDRNGHYAELWEVPTSASKYLKKARPGDEVRISPVLCLKTQRYQYKSIKLANLEKKGFAEKDSLMLKWKIEAKEEIQRKEPNGRSPVGASKGDIPIDQNNNQSELEKSSKSPKHVSFAGKPNLYKVRANDLVNIFETIGGKFTVKSVSKLVANKTELQSKAYTFPSCPCSFSISVQFNTKEELEMFLVVTQTDKQNDDSQYWSFTLKGYGEIRNNAQNYSEIWELKNSGKKMKQLRPGQEKTVVLPVCLKTASGSWDRVTFGTLQKRKFVSPDDRMSFQWSLDVMKA